jgi:hypothetical protein
VFPDEWIGKIFTVNRILVGQHRKLLADNLRAPREHSMRGSPEF